jgi:hypothetical protein
VLRYYQPNPQDLAPFSVVSSLNDPTFSNCASQSANCFDAWALRIINSKIVLIYGAELYSFFDNYDGSKYLVSFESLAISDGMPTKVYRHADEKN